MAESYNCLRLDTGYVFQVEVYENNNEKVFKIDDKEISFEKLRVGQLAKLISLNEKFGDPDKLSLWQVDVHKSKLKPGSTEDNIREHGGVAMEFECKFIKYFQVGYEPKEEDNISIVVVIATAGSSQQGISQVISPEPEAIFEEFLNTKHGQFLKTYIKNNDPLPSYESSRIKTTVPASPKGDRPSLLLHNLPEGNHHPITQVSAILSAMKKAKNNLLVLLGTSGCGKTRTCYELLCKNWGLYFVGARKGNGGSGDIGAIESYLWKNNKITEDFDDNRRNADHVVRCLVLSRLLILSECIKSSTFNPKRWLLLQTCQNIFGPLYNYADDLFKVLAFKLTNCTQSSLEDYIDIMYKEVSSSNIFPIIFDEAQSLQTVLYGKFRSRYDKVEERSLLSPIVQTLKKPTLSFINHCVIPCGTGLGLLSLDEVLSSTGIAKPDLDIDRFTEFERWRDINHVKDYCNGLIDLTEEDYEHIYKHFRGRFRPIVTCLEEIIMGKEINDAVHKLWMTLTQREVVNNRSNQQSLYSQLADIEKTKRTGHVHSENVLELYKNVMLRYEYSGGPVLFTDIKQMTIVETGFGHLREVNPPTASELKKLCKNAELDEDISHSSSVNEKLLLPAHVGEKALVAYIDEPFAIVAGRNYFNENGSLPKEILKIMSKVSDAGACGTLWQRYLPEEFERIFNGETDVRKMPMFAEASENDDLPAFCIGSPKIVKSSNFDVPRVATTAGYSLEEFFNESSEDSHPAFFIPDDRCGPDIIFFVKFDEVTVPVFVQVKLRYSVHTIAGALSTIDPRFFYKDKNGNIYEKQSNIPIIEKIIERCERHGSIGLFVTYPADTNLESFVTNNHRYNIRNRSEHKQLIGIIDHDNASKIFQEDHLLFIDTLKYSMKRKWVNEEAEGSSVSSKKLK